MAVGGRRDNGDHWQPEHHEDHCCRSPQSTLHSDPPLRRKRPFITRLPASPAELSAQWPNIEPRLMANLLRRPNVEYARAEDVCQDVAERMLSRKAAFESVEKFWNWLHRVAHNRLSNLERKDARVTTSEVPDAGTRDVASLVEPRFVLKAVAEDFGKLKETDRRALTTALNNEDRGETKRDRDRVSLQVKRARDRLGRQVKGRLAALPWWRWRWSTDPVPLGMASHAAIGTLAATVGVVSTWVAPQHTDERTVERVSATAVAEDRLYVGVPTTHVSVVTPERAVPAAAPAPGAATGAEPSDGPGTWEHRIVVAPPADAPGKAEVATDRRRRREDTLVCWKNFPHVGDGCVDHPLRRDGEWVVPKP